MKKLDLSKTIWLLVAVYGAVAFLVGLINFISYLSVGMKSVAFIIFGCLHLALFTPSLMLMGFLMLFDKGPKKLFGIATPCVLLAIIVFSSISLLGLFDLAVAFLLYPAFVGAVVNLVMLKGENAEVKQEPSDLDPEFTLDTLDDNRDDAVQE